MLFSVKIPKITIKCQIIAHLEVAKLSQFPDELERLQGQLAGGGEDECTHPRGRRAHRPLAGQLLEERDNERPGFAGARPRHAHHVPSLQ